VRHFCLAGHVALDTPLVGTPIADALLDLLAIEIVFQSLLGEFYDLVVTGEAKTDELIFCKAVDLCVPLGRGESLKTKALFKAYDTVLHLERVLAHSEECDEGGNRKNGDPDGPEAGMQYGEDDRCYEVDYKNSEQYDVKERIEAGVVLKTLGCLRHVRWKPL